MQRFLPLALLSLLAAAPACLDPSDKPAEDGVPADLDALGKDDSFQRPTEHGELAYDVPGTGELTRAAGYHAWEFSVRLSGTTPVTIEVGPQTGDGPEVDTVLYLYKQQPSGRWGRYLARNDDHGDSLWSSIARGLEGGRYRIIVKGYRATTSGAFAVTLGCDRYACSAPMPTCAFGDTFRELDRQRFAFGAQVALRSPAGLDATTQAQLVRAVQASSHTDVTTAAEAFSRVDEGVINRIELRDSIAVRRYVAYEYGAGDNSYGAIFDERDLEPAVEIHDGDFDECRVPAARCLFGTHYDLALEPDLAIARETSFDPGTITTALDRDQILAAAQLHVPSLTTVAAVFDRVTDHEVRRVDVIHTPTRRQYSFYTFILGDHRFGAAFVKDTTQLAVEIEDNVFERCDAF